MGVYRSLSAIAKTWKWLRCLSVNGQIQKCCSLNEIVLGTKKKWPTKPWRDTQEPFKWILLDKRSKSEKITYYMISTVWPRKSKTMEIVKGSVIYTKYCQKREKRDEQVTEDFQGSETIVYHIIMGVCDITRSFKYIECITSRVNPHINYRLWMRMTWE